MYLLSMLDSPLMIMTVMFGVVAKCAIDSGSGWWFYSCFDINPNFQPPVSDWPTRLLLMEIKIHPRGCTME